MLDGVCVCVDDQRCLRIREDKNERDDMQRDRRKERLPNAKNVEITTSSYQLLVVLTLEITGQLL